MRSVVGVLAVVVGVTVACSSKEPSPELDAWKGPSPHLRVLGRFNGEELDVDLAGPETSAAISCSREYTEDEADKKAKKKHLWEIRVRGKLTIEGEERGFELELKRQRFAELPPGTKLTIVPRNDHAPPSRGQIWLEWDWMDGAGTTLVERAAREGEFTLQELTGTPGEDGVVPSATGNVGGLLKARWSETESLSISFSVACGDNQMDDG